MNTAIVVPTFNAGQLWQNFITALLAASVDSHDVYIIDSGSSDETIELAVNAGFNIKKIAPGTFNHGGTRQNAVDGLEGYDFVVFLTQDAILHDAASIQHLLVPFEDGLVAAVCGRQLPHKDAAPIGKHARLFNYIDKSSTSSIEDVGCKGLKAIFLSNSFAAYRLSALNRIGGFPDNVIFGEDMHVAARFLKAGYKIAYAADACVYHSHDYSISQEFKRYFDMGVFHVREPWIIREFGKAEGEGYRFVASELSYLLTHAFWRIPEALLRTVTKYSAYRLGLMEARIPHGVKKRLSMNSGFFNFP